MITLCKDCKYSFVKEQDTLLRCNYHGIRTDKESTCNEIKLINQNKAMLDILTKTVLELKQLIERVENANI